MCAYSFCAAKLHKIKEQAKTKIARVRATELKFVNVTPGHPDRGADDAMSTAAICHLALIKKKIGCLTTPESSLTLNLIP